MHPRSGFLFAAILLLHGPCAAFERDVHFGLTKWLALKAGFTLQEATALATGDQRVDSGDMQFIELAPAYACLAKDEESASLVMRHHYPSAGRMPGPPQQRPVVAGSDASRQLALEVTKIESTQASYMLFRFGEGLHAMQDSWSHQGIPDVPTLFDGAVACDASLAWAHPSSRGGWNSHKADLTHEWPVDTLAMAKATYDLLLQYPNIGDVRRSPSDWTEIRPSLDAFTQASTKTQKKNWFVAQGIGDTSFLEGISLPDGAAPFDERWTGHKLPPLPRLQSTQHHIDAALLEFYSRFFARWAATDDFEAMAAEFGVSPKGRAGAGPHSPGPMDKAELAARLRVWRIRDHGRVANLAHATKALSAAQRTTLASIAKDPKSLARYASPADAYFPIVVKGPDVQPLLGFVIRTIQPGPSGNQRAVAVAKLRNAPYDTVLILGERVDDQWRVTSVGAIVDH